jgi:hypothetical protein
MSAMPRALPEKLGRRAVAAPRVVRTVHYAPNRHDTGSTTARSVDEIALTISTMRVCLSHKFAAPASVTDPNFFIAREAPGP